MIYKIVNHDVSIRTSEPLAVARYSTTTITAFFKNYVPELTKYDLKQLFYYEIPCDCEFSPIFQNGAIADMKTPFKSILKQTIIPYGHTYRDIWVTNYYGSIVPF
jgi:hypothetical protein